MAVVVVTREDATGWEEVFSSDEMRLYLEAKGAEFIEIAQAIFEAHSRHRSAPPIFYQDSFFVDQTVDGIRIGNDDPVAEWVEFGAHAGGKTPVLRYRVLGRTLDVLESRGG